MHPMEHTEPFKCYTCGKKMKRLISAPAFIMTVYRPEELLKKKDTKHSDRDYARKLSTTPPPK